MKNDDPELIQRVLDGDDIAFSVLVKKYQKSVHALAWRKIGNFHIAEDITQDTFLKAYQKLSTLKKPQRFASWLYVIAANRCSTWLRKKRLWTQLLEATNSVQLEKATYSGYVIEENERMMVETQREVVKKRLAKLQESDRTVITLYYFGGMTYQEISKFLGVSVGAIKTRVYRVQQRLKKEEPMIREALENFQITPSLTEWNDWLLGGTNVYGASETNVYRLESDGVTWKQLTPEVPDRVTSLVVDRNVLYVGTQSKGMLHFTVNEE